MNLDTLDFRTAFGSSCQHANITCQFTLSGIRELSTVNLQLVCFSGGQDMDPLVLIVGKHWLNFSQNSIGQKLSPYIYCSFNEAIA